MQYNYSEPDEMIELLDTIGKTEYYGITTLNLIIFTILLVLIFYILISLLVKKIITDEDIVTLKVSNSDSILDIDNELDLSYKTCYEHIKNKYSIDLKNKPNDIIIQAEKLLTQVDITTKNLQLFTQAIDISPNYKAEIKKNINLAGNLIIYVDRELLIINRVLSDLYKKDKSYNEEYKAILSIRSKFKKLERKIITLCLMNINISNE